MLYGVCNDCAEYWRAGLFAHQVCPKEVVALIVVPIKAEEGHRIPSPGFYLQLHRRCEDSHTLLVADDIHSTMSRNSAFSY